jgi:hypothetical protein
MPELPRGFHLPPFVPVPEDLEQLALRLEAQLLVGREDRFQATPTGFPALDAITAGGLHGGDLVLVGGVQNIGKTALILQWAQAMADAGTLAVVVCYEHPPDLLWERLLCQCAAGRQGGGLTRAGLQEAYRAVIRARRCQPEDCEHPLDMVLGRVPHGLEAWAALSARAQHVWLVGGGEHTDLEALSRYVDLAVTGYGFDRVVLFVDYLQRVPVLSTRLLTAEERTEHVLTGLKGLAMQTTERALLSVVAVSAADAAGLRQGRVHLENLWGSSLIQYEPDLAWIGNRDRQAVDGLPQVRWAVEKNRHGVSQVEFRHRFHGASLWFEPQGELVAAADSWQGEREGARPGEDGDD